MAQPKIPPAPKGLQVRGRRAWRSLMATFEFEDRQHLELLHEFCRSLDRIDELQALIDEAGPIIDGRYGPKEHPAGIAQRAQQAVIVKLAHALELPPDTATNEWDYLSTSERARKAALARWHK